MIEKIWYRTFHPLAWLLLPLSGLFCSIAKIRKQFYRWGIFKSHTVAVPVIVVGNISVGGTGKTPLVITLVKQLQEHGFRPGVISRGYGSNLKSGTRTVLPEMSPTETGDEPLLIAQQTGVPVVIGADRVAAANTLLAENKCDLILSDDGLQHYRLRRDAEIVVIDAVRQFGNRFCLPAGPLREPISRLQSIDAVVWNGEKQSTVSNHFSMRLQPGAVYLLNNPNQKKLLADFARQRVHAVAGIGNPERFFAMLRVRGIVVVEHPFPDHHHYVLEDFDFVDSDAEAVLLTAKDAVKCADFSPERLRNVWVVPVETVLETGLFERISIFKH